MKTCICGESNWKYLDELRNPGYWWDQGKLPVGQQLGFKACTNCGFLTYDRQVTEEQMEAYYGADYRKQVEWMNHITCARKNEYHRAFLEENLGAGWFSTAEVLDVGCAQGALIKMLRDEYKASVAGAEPTSGFRKYGIAEYGLDIRERLTDFADRKFDMISYYHVIEHLYDPKRDLERVRDMLKDGGYLYGSVPVWCGVLEETSGSATQDFENLFHKDHVNVFTRQSIRNLLGICGFEVVKVNEHSYGYTFLAMKGKKQSPVKEDWRKLAEIIQAQRNACNLLAQRKPDEALKAFPLYPDAVVAMAYWKENMRDEAVQKKYLDEGLKKMPTNARLLRQRGIVEMQWAGAVKPSEYAKRKAGIEKAIELLERSHKLRPGSEDYYHHMAFIHYAYLGKGEEAVAYWKKGLAINPTKFQEFMSYIGAVRAGVALQPTSQPSSGPDGKYSLNEVTMSVRPAFAAVARNMGAAVKEG